MCSHDYKARKVHLTGRTERLYHDRAEDPDPTLSEKAHICSTIRKDICALKHG